MASTTVSIGGTELTQTTLTAAGLDVGAPSSFDGWYGRIASYRLAASAQEAAGVVEESSASFTVSAADISDTYRLYIWRYYAPPGTSFRGVKGDHTSDADDVTTRTISPTMLVGGDVASINASPRSSANVVAFALSVATQATTSPSIASTALFGGTGLVQDHSNGNMVAGSAHILSYTPVGGTESWDLVTASHPGANGVAMHVITAAYW